MLSCFTGSILETASVKGVGCGVALSFNIAFTFLSGLAPVGAALLAHQSGVPANAAYIMIGCALLWTEGPRLMPVSSARLAGLALGEPP